MQHRAAADFWRHYDALPEAIRTRADKQFSPLKADPQHRSLHFKKVGERRGHELWSARISLNHRALAIRRPYGYLWFWIGDPRTYNALIA